MCIVSYVVYSLFLLLQFLLLLPGSVIPTSVLSSSVSSSSNPSSSVPSSSVLTTSVPASSVPTSKSETYVQKESQTHQVVFLKRRDFSNCSLSKFTSALASFLFHDVLLDSSTCLKPDSATETILNGPFPSFRFYSHLEAVELLNNTHIAAIGDSITRRLFESLHYFLESGSIKLIDDKGRGTKDYSIRLPYFDVTIIFDWQPTMAG